MKLLVKIFLLPFRAMVVFLFFAGSWLKQNNSTANTSWRISQSDSIS